MDHLPEGFHQRTGLSTRRPGPADSVRRMDDPVDVRLAAAVSHDPRATLAQLSDLVFVIDGAKQTLAGSLPNPFFGYVILTFENLMARYFDQNESV